MLERFRKLQILDARGERNDDKDLAIFKTRLEEFRLKTLPVLEHYKQMGLLVSVNGDQSRGEVFSEMVDKLYDFSQN